MLALSSPNALLQYLAVYILVLLPLRAAACFVWVAGSRFRVVYTGLKLHRPEAAVLRQEALSRRCHSCWRRSRLCLPTN